ncbi:MAG: VOC family protein [Steroidobacteraceae bacterium]
MGEAGSVGAPTLDHLGFVGDDLDRLVGAMRRLGFATTTPRELQRESPSGGAPVSLHQSSCHAVLPQGYLEFSAVSTDDPAHHLAAYRARGTGLHILALGSVDPDGDWRRCRDAGLPCSEPAFASRAIEYGLRHGTARFRWFMLAPAAAPEGLLCFAHNLNPELVFQPEVSSHPNGAQALVEVMIQAPSTRELAPRFGALLGVAALPAPEPDGRAAPGGAEVLRFPLAGDACLTVLSPAAMRERFGAAAVAAAPVGRLAGLQLRVARLATTAACLREGGVPFEARGAELVVPAGEACGAVLSFRE